MQPAFLSQTSLALDQERTNFTIMDNPVIDLLSSLEAEKVCSKMLLIYTRLKRANWKYYERPGVLLLHGDGQRTAWEILCELAGVASATLNKAIKWMKEQRVIGYWAGKNNAGIRVFFNVALASVRQKNLRLVPTSLGSADTSANEAPFKDSFAVQNNQDLERRALRDEPNLPSPNDDVAAPVAPTKPTLQLVPPPPATPSTELRLAFVEALARQMEAMQRTLQDLARRIPSQAWLENAAIPKAIRVALAEVFRQQHGRRRLADNTYVGAARPSPDIALPPPQPIEHSAAYRTTLESVRELVSPQALECWFAPMNLITGNDGTRVLVAPDSVFRDWIMNNFADVLESVGLNDCEWQFPMKEETNEQNRN